jgi:hypothetical protein
MVASGQGRLTRRRRAARRRPGRCSSTSMTDHGSASPGQVAARRPRARRAAGRRRRRRLPRRSGRAFGSWPYSLASDTPAPCSSSTRRAARSRNSSRGPYWIDSVGQALAHADSRPPQPVVAQRALPGPSVIFAPVNDPVRTAGHAVAAAVADIGLHHHGPEFGAKQGSGRTDVEASGVRAVLAHVRSHQPAELGALMLAWPSAGQVECREFQVCRRGAEFAAPASGLVQRRCHGLVHGLGG